jgi:hypothetical protein
VTNERGTQSVARPLVQFFNSSSTSKIALLLVLLVTTSGFATAAVKVSHNLCAITDQEAAGMSGDFSTDIHALPEYVDVIARMLKAERFKQLDCLADHARSAKERFPGGMWKLHVLYQGLYNPVPRPLHATERDWTIHLARLQRWVAARPRSVTARVALATAYIDYGWSARGTGYSNTVSESGWKLYEQRIARAKNILENASSLPSKCPEWYMARLLVAANQDGDVAELRAFFDKAYKFEPGYYYYARIMAQHLLPKWGGQPGDAEGFAQEVADRIGGDGGDILYFQIASTLNCGCGDDLKMSWERIERGFESSGKVYGASMLNLNLIAFLATHNPQPHPVVANLALTRIGEQWDEETWKKREEFESAKQWAANSAPMEAKRNAMESAADANIHTAEGPPYKASFEKKYRELVQQCVRTEGGSLDKFETLTSVGEKGTVEEIRVYWNGPAAMCIYQKLHAFQQEKGTPFPPPPQAPYWIRLDLDASEFAPVAAK